MSPAAEGGKARAATHARQLVKRLRDANKRAERRGAAPVPDDEYAALERELTRKLARHLT
jgi:hypothetical protein